MLATSVGQIFSEEDEMSSTLPPNRVGSTPATNISDGCVSEIQKYIGAIQIICDTFSAATTVFLDLEN
jgi:hypothetical protein